MIQQRGIIQLHKHGKLSNFIPVPVTEKLSKVLQFFSGNRTKYKKYIARVFTGVPKAPGWYMMYYTTSSHTDREDIAYIGSTGSLKDRAIQHYTDRHIPYVFQDKDWTGNFKDLVKLFISKMGGNVEADFHEEYTYAKKRFATHWIYVEATGPNRYDPAYLKGVEAWLIDRFNPPTNERGERLVPSSKAEIVHEVLALSFEDLMVKAR